jgi:hypothetical protein
VCLIAPVASESHVISSYPLGLTFIKQDSPLFSPIRILNASGDEALEHFSVSALASHPVMDQFVVGTSDGTVRFVHLDLEQSDDVSRRDGDSIVLQSRVNADEDIDSEEDEEDGEERLSRMRQMDEGEESDDHDEKEEGEKEEEKEGEKEEEEDGVEKTVSSGEGAVPIECGEEEASIRPVNDEESECKESLMVSKDSVDEKPGDV